MIMFNSLEDKFFIQARELLHPSVHLPGQSGWECPSNIALIKYWGKKQFQQPINPSVSMTLQQSRTILSVDYHYQRKPEKMSLTYFSESHRIGNQIAKFLSAFSRNSVIRILLRGPGAGTL
jgi:hypothetical protein